MGSVMLGKLPGNFWEGDKGTKAILGKPHTEQSWDGGHLEVPSAEMADRGNLSSNASQASAPTPCLLLSEPRARPTSPTRATLGRSRGWEDTGSMHRVTKGTLEPGPPSSPRD